MNLFAGSLLVAATLLANAGVNQSAIDEVRSGKRTEARASWWGFDPEDSTAALQSAIDSGAKRVIVEDMGRPWIVTPLQAASNQELVFEKGAVLQAKKGEFKGSTDSLLSVTGKKNVTIRGEGATFRMHRDDYAKPPYKKAEWRHTLQIKSSSNVQVLGLTMAESGGDGIYLGVATRGVTNKNIVTRDVVLDKHYRQGISVITAEDLLIENTVMRDTGGTSPMAGIDFEPNHFSERLVNCVMRNCIAENNQGVGYAFYLPNLTAQSAPISIRLENCIARGSNRAPLSFTNGEGKGQGPMTGTIEFVDCDFSGGSGPVATMNRKPAVGARVRFINCRLEPGASKPTTPVIFFASRAGNQLDVGGVDFENCQVHDPQQRPLIGFYDGARELHLIDVTGTLKTTSGDTQRTVEIDQKYLDDLHPGNKFQRFPKYETDGTTFIPLRAMKPDAMLPQPNFTLRGSGTFVLFAESGTPVELKLNHSHVGNYTGTPVVVEAIAPSGKKLPIGEVPLDTTGSLGFVAPETGIYQIPINVGPNKFSLEATNCPTVISSETGRVRFVYSSGKLFFYVPPGTKQFGVKASGDGGEVVGLSVLNPQGKSVWQKEKISGPQQFVGVPESQQGEVWTLQISRPSSGRMEDYFIELQGLPPFMATHRDCLLQPAP
ncbi:hypothetical protein [Rosistilla oblonga]|uniref:hypothetical protein n=1 Tax=Rosistilla oblonga TaxID=2527990 RepID=UPI003A96FD9A